MLIKIKSSEQRIDIKPSYTEEEHRGGGGGGEEVRRLTLSLRRALKASIASFLFAYTCGSFLDDGASISQSLKQSKTLTAQNYNCTKL